MTFLIKLDKINMNQVGEASDGNTLESLLEKFPIEFLIGFNKCLSLRSLLSRTQFRLIDLRS